MKTLSRFLWADGHGAGFFIGNWTFSFFWDPRRWAITLKPGCFCCKHVFLIGPFEALRHFTEDDYDDKVPMVRTE